MKPGARERKRGQSMVEFALIAPTFFLLVFGIVEFGLLMFNVASTRYAAGEAAKVEANIGSAFSLCSKVPGCNRLHSGAANCDADCQAIVSINNSPVGTTSLEAVNWIEIRQCPLSACPNPACTDAAHSVPAGPLGCTFGTYVIRTAADACFPADLAHCTASYLSSTRSTAAGSPEYLQVTVSYRYDWKTGLLRAIHNAPVDLTTSYLVRIEPQKF